MRIRKSVADGYSVQTRASYDSHYNQQNFGVLPQGQQSFSRVPLPAHMDQPPPLSSVGSTFQSGLNVSSWGSTLGTSNVMTLPTGQGSKRRLEEDEPVIAQPRFEEFIQQGELRFDEDF